MRMGRLVAAAAGRYELQVFSNSTRDLISRSITLQNVVVASAGGAAVAPTLILQFPFVPVRLERGGDVRDGRGL